MPTKEELLAATGRSDFSNLVNNSLVFPGVFRGALDVRARTITDEMGIAAAHKLARCAEERGIHVESILPSMDEWEVVPRVAAATALKAQEQGLARVRKSRQELLDAAAKKIREARDATHALMKEGVIALPPSC